jgi:RNA recognition motif-containing protein
MKWGDIPGILNEKLSSNTSSRRNSFDSDASDDTDDTDDTDEPDITLLLRTKKQYNKPQEVIKPIEIELPEFTPGIKTVITRNLPRDIKVEQLRTVFEKYGPIRDIYIPKNMDKNSPYFGTIKGFAMIKYLKPTDSARAFQKEYGRLTIGKNNIILEFAKEDR